RHRAAGPAAPARPGRAGSRAPAAAADGTLDGGRAQRRTDPRRALPGGPGPAPEPAPDPLFGGLLAAAGTRRQQAAAPGADAPRLRRQRLPRVAHPADRGPRLPGHARPGGLPRVGPDAGGDAEAVAAHDPAGRGPAGTVAAGGARQPA